MTILANEWKLAGARKEHGYHFETQILKRLHPIYMKAVKWSKSMHMWGLGCIHQNIDELRGNDRKFSAKLSRSDTRAWPMATVFSTAFPRMF
jgi:hypothetical protein